MSPLIAGVVTLVLMGFAVFFAVVDPLFFPLTLGQTMIVVGSAFVVGLLIFWSLQTHTGQMDLIFDFLMMCAIVAIAGQPPG